MKRTMHLLALLLLFLSVSVCARAQQRTYGGSGDDAISGMAVGTDGRVVLTGYTTSADGTLDDRTKSGRSGWVMCLDAQGNVLWNFCSRHDVQDRMRHPVIHEDGTISVILISVSGAHEQVSEEWIHLTAEGEIIERERIPGEGGVLFFVGEDGYIQAQTGETERQFYLIPWKSTQRMLLQIDADPGAQIEELSGVYFLMESFDMSRRLMALDAQMHGQEWAIRSGVPEARVYRRILSLADGGLAAVGRLQEGFGAEYVFTRWDAQGNVLADCMLSVADMPSLICETEGGFLMLDFYGTLTKASWDGVVQWQERIEVPGSAQGMAVLPNGELLIACNRGETGMQDVWTTSMRVR